MGDNEIISKLEELKYHLTASKHKRFIDDAVEYFNSTREEKEALIAGQETMSKHIEEQQAEIKALTIRTAKQEATIERLEDEKSDLQSEVYDAQAEIERLQNTIISLSDYLDIVGIDKTDTSIVRTATELNAQIRTDIKIKDREEFVDRLKTHIAALEYNADTPRKTVPIETLYAQVNWILKDIIPKTIDNALKEMERHTENRIKPEYRDGDPDCPICPNCRMPLNEMEDCPCGQKIDWSEE